MLLQRGRQAANDEGCHRFSGLRHMAVSGALQARDWTDKNGNKRRTFEIVTTNVELLSSKRNSQDTTNTGTAQNAGYGQPSAPQQTARGNGYSQQGFGGYQEITEDDPALPF